MIVYLPSIYPDELVYSWLCRYYVHSGHLTHKAVLQELFCKRSDAPSKEFIGNLNEEAKKVIEKQYSLDELVLNHTMFPMYARFVPLEQKKRALYHIEQDHCDVHQLFSVLPRAGDERYMRYCPICTEEDRKRYGEAYWHRRHQIRNMGACTKHGCRLNVTSVPMKNEQNYVFYPAEYAIQDYSVVIEDDPQALAFSAYLEAVFDAPLVLERDISVSAVLYAEMSGTKYMKSSGRSRYTKMLADDMNDRYRRMGLQNIASMYQIQRTLLGEQQDSSVVCQIAYFLGIDVRALTEPELTEEQVRKEKTSHCVKGSVPVDWEMLDRETAPRLETFAKGLYGGSVNENGRPERVSERLVYRKMGLKRHQLENMPRCREIFEKYAESYPENWARKIIWAYKKLDEAGMPFYWSDIRKMTGVKKSSLPLVWPHLQMRMDKEMLKRLALQVDVNWE